LVIVLCKLASHTLVQCACGLGDKELYDTNHWSSLLQVHGKREKLLSTSEWDISSQSFILLAGVSGIIYIIGV